MNASARHREQPVDLHLEHPGCGANSARGLLSLACGSSWLFFLLFFFFFFKVISEDGRLPTISATRLRPACSARWRNGWRFSASSAVLLEVDVGEGELEVSSLEGSDFVAVGRCAAAHWHSGSSEGSGGTTEGRSLLRFPVMIFLSFNRRFEGDEDIGFTMKFWVGDNRNLRQAFPATQAPHARMSFENASRRAPPSSWAVVVKPRSGLPALRGNECCAVECAAAGGDGAGAISQPSRIYHRAMSLGGILPKGNNDHAHSLPTALCPQTLSDRIEGMKERSHAMLAAEWATSKMRTDITQKQLQEIKTISQEMQQAQAVLLIERKTRMKEFLAYEAAIFEQQLNAMGKAFCKDR